MRDCVAGSNALAINETCECTLADAVTQPHFFANVPVFIDHEHACQMRQLVAAVQRVIALPRYRAMALARAPAIASIPQASLGVLAGFDFHVTGEGPRLIEMNTNAGGGILNARARALNPPCCSDDSGTFVPTESGVAVEAAFLQSFLADWRARRGAAELRTVAIVDDDPAGQHLYPEFLLACDLFARAGIHAFIVDASALEFSGGELHAGGLKIDLVYNRLTDFCLERAEHSALARAYEADAAVVTPHPFGHALLADKRNLCVFSSEASLASLGASDDDIRSITALVPQTLDVSSDLRDWWGARKNWFFKPYGGFGSRGAYRGDKLTRRAFADVAAGGYVAQAYAPPGVRHAAAGAHEKFKSDIRVYAYQGVAHMMVARLYQGQTTNFRTPGGGFAPVYELRSTTRPAAPNKPCNTASIALGDDCPQT